MKIAIVGTGYVGLVQGVVLSEFGMNVLCLDKDKTKIDKLKKGIVPIYEPGLEEVMARNIAANRLRFTTDSQEAFNFADIIFIAVGTPPAEDGSADLSHVRLVAEEIGQSIIGYKIIVNKSTVPVGTGRLVHDIITQQIKNRNVDARIDIVSNPEFLREGKAVQDCFKPDRVVIGCESENAKKIMQDIYNVLFINQTPFVFTNLETAELIKYASNAFLAVKISFINEIALLAEKVGANTQEIAKAMGMDGRISPKFLHCGPGYGGSCFPKDTLALSRIGRDSGEEMLVVEAAIKANHKQKARMISKIINSMNSINDKTIAILGLSFKPETDDMRDAPSIDIIKGLIAAGAKIRAFCPKGMIEARWRLADSAKDIYYARDEYDSADSADAIVLITEWNQFRGLDLIELRKNMQGSFFFDLRNVFSRSREIRQLFNYFAVGQT